MDNHSLYSIKRLANGDLQSENMGRHPHPPQSGLGQNIDPAYARGRTWRRQHPQPFDKNEPRPAGAGAFAFVA